MYADRKLIALADDIKRWIESRDRLTPSEILAKVDFETGKIATFTGAKSNALKNARDVAKESYEQFEKTANGENVYIPSGIDAIDDFTNGFFRGRLYMFSAASNDGKSSLALDIVNNLAVDNGRKVFLLTLESSAQEIHNKLIQIRTGIPSLRIEKASIRDEEQEKFRKAYKDISDAPIIYDDSSELILPILRTKIRKAVADGAELVIIDQLEQLLIGGGGDTQAEHIRINYIAYRVKAYAREMNVPIILIHQMNRSADSGQNRGKFVDVTLADLAQAGEKPCDAVLMIRHKKMNQKIIESYFIWVKNRQGKKGQRQVEFVGERLLFKDIEGKSEFKPHDGMQEELPDWAMQMDEEQVNV
jgi:replicative DNA helicase